ncbi:MAG: 5'-methylthioadenosine/adenosylhomocysteine nucleosidase [Oscillospiraceae bacterium]|jgi:adenosylhomocysteine nucleosidase|nr:5'-methylthioadenosine/adenosylhomocysteine nucleosidase [Oscillospiraceae bacterium]
MIGIIGALSKEIDQLIAQIDEPQEEIISRVKFYFGKLCGQEVVVAKSGVGKVNAAIATQTMILKFKPELIVNSGVAGAISPDVEIGDIVIASQVVQHDVDTSALGDPVGFISGLDLVMVECHKEKSQELLEVARVVAGQNRATLGVIATGDNFVSKREDGEWINRQFGAVAVEMEGGSVGQSCFVNTVDFCVVRVISDSIYRNSPADYDEFVGYAAAKSIRVMSDFLKLRP